MIALTVAGCPLRQSFSDQVAEHVGAVAGVESTRVGFDVMTPDERATLTTKLRGGVAGRTKGIAVDRSHARARRRERQGRRRQVDADDEPRRRVRARSATRSACSTPTSTATRSPTCSASTSGR